MTPNTSLPALNSVLPNIETSIQKLRSLCEPLLELQRRHENGWITYLDLLPPQIRVANCPDQYRLFRGGNQGIAKTNYGLMEVIHRCRGTYDFGYQIRPPPITCWIVCVSWPQSVEIQNKFWTLVPKDELDENTVFSEATGFRGKHPFVRFKNGSIVRFKTSLQGPRALSGASVDFILIDEPPKDKNVYAECHRRVSARGGSLLMDLTPLYTDCSWIQEECVNGRLTDLHFETTVENMIPEGWDRPYVGPDGVRRDQNWIDSTEKGLNPAEVPVRLHGEWEFRVTESMFGHCFRTTGPDSHCQDILIHHTKNRIFLGIDWGSGNKFSQCAVLVEEDQKKVLHVIDEYVSSSATTTEQDAHAVLEMLARNGLKWENIDRAYGDRVHMAKTLQQKSNRQFLSAIEKIRKLKRGSLEPEIWTVKRGQGRAQGSVDLGHRFLNQKFLTNGIYINPICVNLIDSLYRYTGADDDAKHLVDSLRYALNSQIFTDRKRTKIKGAHFDY